MIDAVEDEAGINLPKHSINKILRMKLKCKYK